MNILTRKIRNKGYTLQEFCDHIGRCIRWYRTHEYKDNAQNKLIRVTIDELEVKLPVRVNKITIGHGGVDSKYTLTETDSTEFYNKQSDDWKDK